MRQAVRFAQEIRRKKEALGRTKSEYLRRDYKKSIARDIEELRAYCKYKGLDINVIEGEL